MALLGASNVPASHGVPAFVLSGPMSSRFLISLTIQSNCANLTVAEMVLIKDSFSTYHSARI